MYPTLSDLLKDLFGINLPLPIQMFGLMVAFAFVAGSAVLAAELKRKAQQGLLHPTKKTYIDGLPASMSELVTNGIFGFLLGYKLFDIVANYSVFTQDPAAMLLSTQGNFGGGLVFGALFAYLAYREKNKKKLEKPVTRIVDVYPHEQVGTIVIIAAVAGILGAKIFHNLENWNEFITSPIESLLSFSGLTFYGGLIVGTAAVLWFAKKNGIKVIHLMDSAAPALMLSYAIGRIGCQLSGDGDWGIVNTSVKPSSLSFIPDWMWSFKYPHNVLNEGVPIPGCVGNHCMELAQPVYPTPLYEVMMCGLLFVFLWSIRKKINIPGMIFFIYLFVNGLERFLIEKIRVNTLYNVSGFTFTQAELISSLLMFAGVMGIWLTYQQHLKRGESSK